MVVRGEIGVALGVFPQGGLLFFVSPCRSICRMPCPGQIVFFVPGGSSIWLPFLYSFLWQPGSFDGRGALGQ